jgi:hypothetical protein
MNKKLGIPLIIVLAVLAVWALAPSALVHGIIFGLFLGLPYIIVIIIAAAIVILAFTSDNTLGTVVLVLAVIGLFIALPLMAATGQHKMVQNVTVENLDEPFATSNVRYMPMPVAVQLASNKYQDSRHHLGDMDPIILEDGNVGWVGSRVPTGFINVLFGEVQGIITITPSGVVTTQDQTFACGEEMAITDKITWQLWRDHYLTELDEYFYVNIDDELVMVAPYSTWDFDFPVFVPQWGGVFIIDGDCHIEDLSPSEAMADERLDGIRIVPEEYARRLSEAWKYENGISNAWFIHEDQTEVPQITGEDNQMPYLIPTDIGEQWFIALEPHGPAFSIYKMMFVDAHTGAVSMYTYPEDAAIISPNKAAGFIRAANPNFDWGNDGSGNVVVIEPRPVIVNDILYWMMSQTNVEHSGVQKTFLVRSTDEKVIEMNSLDELLDFLSGERSADSFVNVDDLPQDLTTLTVNELYDLLERLAEELQNR